MKQRQDIFFAVTSPGLERICARELEQLGFNSVAPVTGGVEFRGGLRELYLANLWLRTASRVLVRVGEVHARDFPGLFRKAVKLPWGRFLLPGRGCEVRASCHRSRLSHSGRVSETILEAIGKALGGTSALGAERSLVLARLEEDRCLLSVDSSGALLHRRGYRHRAVVAPLRETLAAGILLTLGWERGVALVDAMTGSGTFAIEAALLAANIPPGRERIFAFMDWPRYREGLWKTLLTEAERQRIESLPAPILAVDLNPDAVETARENAAAAGVAGLIEFSVQPMQELRKPAGEGLILCNPPYGERLGRDARLEELYAELGQLYWDEFAGWQAAFISPGRLLASATGLRCRTRMIFSNGGLKVRLLEKAEKS